MIASHEHGYVVQLSRLPVLDRFENTSTHFGYGFATRRFDDGAQSFQTELLTRLVHGFGDAIGVKNQQVIVLEFRSGVGRQL